MAASTLSVTLFLCLFVCLVSGSEYGEHFLEGGHFKECCTNVGFVDRTTPQIYCYAGQEKHPLRTFETVIMNINIPPDSYKLYEGFTAEDVLLEFESQHSLWHYNPFSFKRKDVRLNPFNQTCIGIVSSRNYRVELNVIKVDYWRVVQFVLGILLFVFGPRLSKNVFFYYVCGITFGVGASFLILVYFMSRLFPRLRPLMYGFFLGGSAITFYAFQLMMDNVRTISMLYKEYVIGYFFTTSLISFIVCYRFGPVSDPRSINLIKWCLQRPLMYGFFLGGSAITFYAFQLMMDNVRTISMLYKEYVIGYFFTTSLISFIVCYRFGPVSDPRSINLIKWCLQGAALVSIFMCSYFQEAVLGVDLLLLVTYNIPKSWFISIITLMKRFRPTPKRKLLSEDEYHEQGARETARALDELRGYCSSPDCDQWRVMTRLKNPIRFAKFVQGSSHLDDDEVLAYDVDSTKNGIASPQDYFTDDSD
ncbi:nuclear envelope integral membrane protein 1a-like [Nilaparvata lugens]|uniref:nuclear envelope integral membrane protein 1a-like n=1 Tax=Nilaparvata lugens TaxID=108931 RepID=UPI00193E94C8|nr:nuclear envelope integral membrane protein 1a-like [Nilaparvata lugens]